MIFGSGYYLSTVSEYTQLLIYLPLLWVVFELFSLAITKKTIYLSKKNILAVLFLLFPILLQLLMGFTFGSSEIKYIVIIIFAFFISSTVDYAKYIKSFVYVIIILSLFAIIGFAIFSTSILNVIPTVQNYNGYTYYSGYFFSGIKYGDNIFYERLQGAFWEPGLLATYIALALFFIKKTYFKSKITYAFSVVLLVVTMLLSRSGAGIIMLVMILVIRLFDNKTVSAGLTATICVSLTLFFLFGESILKYLNQYLFVKLQGDGVVTVLNRLNSIIADITIFINNPFGVGFSGYSKSIVDFSLVSSAGTSTLTSFLARFGILGIFNICFWISALHGICKSKKFISYWGSMCLFLLILLKEPHATLLIMNCLIFYNSQFMTNRQGILICN